MCFVLFPIFIYCEFQLLPSPTFTPPPPLCSSLQIRPRYGTVLQLFSIRIDEKIRDLYLNLASECVTTDSKWFAETSAQSSLQLYSLYTYTILYTDIYKSYCVWWPRLFCLHYLQFFFCAAGKRGRVKWEGVNALQSTRVERGLPVKPIYHITQYTMRVWLKVKVKIGGAFNFMSFFCFSLFFLFGSTANVPLKF